MSQQAPQRDASLWCPQQVDVIGGGLWSRVIAETLCGMLPSDVEIGVHSPGNYPVLRDWAERLQLTNRVRVSAEWPSLEGSGSKALIVANAARDHAKTVERALPSKIPILVEKPFTLTAVDTRHLMDLAENCGGTLAASHVFLSARYTQNFAAMLCREAPILGLNFRWSDPRAEVRHGEKKSFDASLPLHVDVLPHISSLAGALLPGKPQSCALVSVLRGGAELIVDLRVGDVSCAVELARNAPQRRRVIEASTPKGNFTLDFTAEPRVINPDGRIQDADPEWNTKERPLACMLRAFLRGAVTGSLDQRFSMAKALQGNALADEVTPSYRKAVDEWLVEALSRQAPETDADVRYALREKLLKGERAEAAAVEARVDEALRSLQGGTVDNVIDFIAQES